MKKLIFICAAFLPGLPLCALAGEFKDKGEIVAVDFPSGWVTGKTDDPSVTLKLEKGKFFFEFSKLDSELGDYYLKARVKEQVDSLRSKGNTLSGDIKSASLHGVSNAYYTSYDSLGSDAYMAFFTYNGVSYAVSGRGMDEGGFRNVLSSIRKPGEKIEMPKPKKIKTARRKKESDEDDEFRTQVFKDGSSDVSTVPVVSAASSSTGTVAAVEGSTQSVAAAAGEAAQNFLTDLANKQDAAGSPPYIPRQPLPLRFWAMVIGLWVAGSIVARGMAATYKNPKLPPPPAEVPPDFFFPFVVSRVTTFKDVTYNVLTRQKQLLLASFPYPHELYLAGSVYGCLFFHMAWSLLVSRGPGDAVVNSMLRVPLLGRAFASLPEIFFTLPFLFGAFIYLSRKRMLDIYDAQSTLVMTVTPETDYGLIRDGGGKEVARLVRKGGFADRRWEFVDTDNLVIFNIRDDFPRGYLLRKLFGNLGGALRSRYGIFAQDRRAGYVFLDPSSSDRFQIHLDYAFSRLGHPAQILAAVLYVISREKDPIYPSPF